MLSENIISNIILVCVILFLLIFYSGIFILLIEMTKKDFLQVIEQPNVLDFALLLIDILLIIVYICCLIYYVPTAFELLLHCIHF